MDSVEPAYTIRLWNSNCVKDHILKNDLENCLKAFDYILNYFNTVLTYTYPDPNKPLEVKPIYAGGGWAHTITVRDSGLLDNVYPNLRRLLEKYFPIISNNDKQQITDNFDEIKYMLHTLTTFSHMAKGYAYDKQSKNDIFIMYAIHLYNVVTPYLKSCVNKRDL